MENFTSQKKNFFKYQDKSVYDIFTFQVLG